MKIPTWLSNKSSNAWSCAVNQILENKNRNLPKITSNWRLKCLRQHRSWQRHGQYSSANRIRVLPKTVLPPSLSSGRNGSKHSGCPITQRKWWCNKARGVVAGVECTCAWMTCHAWITYMTCHGIQAWCHNVQNCGIVTLVNVTLSQSFGTKLRSPFMFWSGLERL